MSESGRGLSAKGSRPLFFLMPYRVTCLRIINLLTLWLFKFSHFLILVDFYPAGE